MVYLSKLATFGGVLASVVACGGASRTLRAPQPAPSIALLDAGAAPRQRLRYEPTLHAPERVEASMKLRMTTAFTNTVLANGRRSVDLPTIRTVGRLEVTGFTATGDAIVAYDLEDISLLDDVVDSAVRARVQAEVRAMAGSRMTWQLSPSGAWSHLDGGLPSATRPTPLRLQNLRESMQDGGVEFPVEDIGIGASWRVTSRLSLAGVTWARTATYRLRTLEGSTATVETAVVMTAASQDLSVEPNATTTLTSGTATATGEMIVPLHGLVATGQTTEASESNLLIVRGHQRLISTLSTEILFFTKPAAAAPAPDGT